MRKTIALPLLSVIGAALLLAQTPQLNPQQSSAPQPSPTQQRTNNTGKRARSLRKAHTGTPQRAHSELAGAPHRAAPGFGAGAIKKGGLDKKKMPDSNDRPFRPNERSKEALLRDTQQRLEQARMKQPFIGDPIYHKTVGRTNPTDGHYPSTPITRQQDWELVRKVSSQLSPELNSAMREEILLKGDRFFKEHRNTLEAAVSENRTRIIEWLEKADLSKEISGAIEAASKPVPNDSTSMDKGREIGHYSPAAPSKQDIEPGKE